MAKGVLGNDPFQQGAATRAPAEPRPSSAPKRKPKRASAPRPVAVEPAPEPAPEVFVESEVRALAPREPSFYERASQAIQLARAVVGQVFESRPVRDLTSTVTGSYRAIASGLGKGDPGVLDAYGRDAELVRQLGPLVRVLCERYWRIEIEGAEHLPDGPAVVVANHSGVLPYDGPVLAYAISRERPALPEGRWLVEDRLLETPVLGTLLNRIGAVRSTPDNALGLLASRHPILVFPEGLSGLGKSRDERHQLRRFGRGGFVKIASRAKVPIIPAALSGAEDAGPLYGKLPLRLLGMPYIPLTSPVPLPSRWRIRFGEPIRAHGIDQDAAQVEQVNEQTRAAVERLLSEI